MPGASDTFEAAFPIAAILRSEACADTHVLALATCEAWEKNGAAFEEAIHDHAQEIDHAIVPIGRNIDEIDTIVTTLVDRIPAATKISLDITLGFRHLPFVYLAALVYLVGLRKCSVGEIYYGALEATTNGVVPIIVITPIFELLQWFESLAASRATGSYTQVARLAKHVLLPLLQTSQVGNDAAKLARDLGTMAAASANGLPLELGLYARSVAATANKALKSGALRNTAARVAIEAVIEEVEPFAVSATDGRYDSKKAIELSDSEIARQIDLAEHYVERGSINLATQIIREVIPSLYLLKHGSFGSWLSLESRSAADSELYHAQQRTVHRVGTETDKEWASLFSTTCDIRNRYAHVGMREKDIFPLRDAPKVHQIIDSLRTLLKQHKTTTMQVCPAVTVLVTPLGFSPGVLFTLLSHEIPSVLVCLCSKKSEAHLNDVLKLSARAPRVERFVLEDPYTGFEELNLMLSSRKQSLAHIFSPMADVMVNTTGGTTLLGYGAERFAREAENLGAKVRRVATVDRRSPQAQSEQPYVVGEIVALP